MHSKQWIDKEISIGHVELQMGSVLQDVRLRYLQRGVPNAPKDNIILLPGYYGGAMAGNLPLANGDSPLMDEHWCLIIPGMLGAGESISPSNAGNSQHGASFPAISLADQVLVQRRMLDLLFGDYRLALVAGWSLGGMQSLQWGCFYPDRVARVAAWCSGVKCYPHNLLFLLGLKAALQADPHCSNGAKPVDGLRAFARVYASRAYGPRFLGDGLFRQLGFESIDQLLQFWEEDHLTMNHHDLLSVLDMWARADISDNGLFKGDINAALAALKMPTLIMPCLTDQYFLADEAKADAMRMPAAIYQPIDSDWGHCAGGPGRDPAAMKQLFSALRELLAL
ncbi:alpha/beta fold hydrolase [Alcanivorax sp. 1008]|uniref:alpha/beta fold hydrolase n=1 Tax=Alcanivorax sp. 1008 TaxID=2816853 RepID=UPI001D790E60|nr:alpha/beta fold hydrolase [Alcanivorax sp. 1008]MCC1495638.1 alpha/beta fold hydrolase [Alcanivorax sp. 1008]